MFRLTLFLAAGIFLSDCFSHGAMFLAVPGMAACALLAGMFVSYRKQRYDVRWLFGIMACLFMFCVGALLVQHRWKQVFYRWPAESNLYQGVIVESPQEKAKTYLCKMDVESRMSADHSVPVSRPLLVYIAKDSLSATLQCGDCLRFYTRVSQPLPTGIPGDFDYASYLYRHQISGTAVVFSGHWQLCGQRLPLTWKQRAAAWRKQILSYYRQWGFTGDEFAVLSAMTVGYKEELSDELQDTYRTAGVSHVLALSGMHVAIIWGLLAWLMRPLDRTRLLGWVKCIVIVLLLWGFAFLVGLSASVVRAVVMCMLMTVARAAGGRAFSMNTLAVAAFFMLLYNPFYLFDVGFQLSFLAVFSILLIYPVLYRCLTFRYSLLRYVWGVMAVSLAAQLGTAPLVIYYFSYFPVHFLLANLIVAPLALLIIYGAVAVIILSPWALLHGWSVAGLNGLIRFLNHSMQWVEHLPLAEYGSVRISVLQVCLLYLLGGLLWVYGHRRSRKVLIGLLVVADLFAGSVFCRYWFREEEPRLYLSRSQVRSVSGIELWQREGIYSHKGITVCLLTDDRWQNKTADTLLDVDYLYVCRGYRGTLASLQQLFRIRKVVLDASLSDYRLNRLKEECESIGLEYTDLSAEGAYQYLPVW